MMGTFMLCPQKMRYQLDGWETPIKSDAFVFGSFFHWLIEQHVSSIALDGQGLGSSFGRLEKKWRKTSDAKNVAKAETLELHIAMAAALYPVYCDYWWDKDTERDWVGIESQFDVVWKGYRLRGMRDGMYRLAAGKRIRRWLLETKTTARITGNTLTQKLVFDFQNLFYLTATEAEQSRSQIYSGVDYNVIRKPQLRQQVNESLPDFTKRMRLDIAKRPEWYFQRFEVAYTPKQKARFQAELLAKLQYFERWLEGDEYTWRNQGSCDAKFPCTYLAACAQGDMVGYTQTREMFRELTIRGGK